MAKKCHVTGKKKRVANLVSHSHRKTKTTQEANLQWKRFFNPVTKKWVRLRVSTSVLRTITKKGLAAVLRKNGKAGLLK